MFFFCYCFHLLVCVVCVYSDVRALVYIYKHTIDLQDSNTLTVITLITINSHSNSSMICINAVINHFIEWN